MKHKLATNETYDDWASQSVCALNRVTRESRLMAPMHLRRLRIVASFMRFIEPVPVCVPGPLLLLAGLLEMCTLEKPVKMPWKMPNPRLASIHRAGRCLRLPLAPTFLALLSAGPLWSHLRPHASVVICSPHQRGIGSVYVHYARSGR